MSLLRDFIKLSLGATLSAGFALTAYAAAPTPVVEIIQAPPIAAPTKGAAWWIVGVVGAVAFGLGLALGLLLG